MDSDAALARAHELASCAIRLSNPNPRVGCVLLSSTSEVVGEGFTQQAGGPHAEVMALNDAHVRGLSTKGATAYVTLEPCSHHGRTGPCCEALVEAGICCVVVALADPNPLVAGRGLERLRAAGVKVNLLPPDHRVALASRELNIGFFSRMLRGTPWVRMKIAASLDGTSALANGRSQWITSEPARADGHAWRARACAVLTGIGTVLQDQPRLDVRLVKTPRQPHLVVVDSDLQMPLDAPLWDVADRRVFVYAANPATRRAAAIEARGATLRLLPGHTHDGSATATGTASAKVDLAAMLHDLARLEVNELHVEAGQKLNGSLLRAGLVDELLFYLAPKLLGPGASIANLPELEDLKDAVELQFQAVTQVGEDLRVIARVTGRNSF
jgi:diaminohydroxyphosphoribosylaminopyrimidine deaminase/5-amino-6-(5-phosphoribosylamino)uracil reductase